MRITWSALEIELLNPIVVCGFNNIFATVLPILEQSHTKNKCPSKNLIFVVQVPGEQDVMKYNLSGGW